MFGGTGGCTTSLGDWRASPPAAYRATSALASAATVWFSYRSCGVRSSPSWAAVIATLIATSESPPSSKKLAFRSIESTPRHCAQMRCNVASIGDLPLVAAWACSAVASGRRGRDPVGRARRPLPTRRLACDRPNAVGAQRNSREAIPAVAGDRRAGVSSRRRPPPTRVARAPAGRCRGRSRFWAWWRISRTAR